MSDTAPVHAKLLVKLHSQASRMIDLLADSFTIGRKADNDLAIEDQRTSVRLRPYPSLHPPIWTGR